MAKSRKSTSAPTTTQNETTNNEEEVVVTNPTTQTEIETQNETIINEEVVMTNPTTQTEIETQPELTPATEFKEILRVGNFSTRMIEVNGKEKFFVIADEGDLDTRRTNPKGIGRALAEAITGWSAVLPEDELRLAWTLNAQTMGQVVTRSLERAKPDRSLTDTEQKVYDHIMTTADEANIPKTWKAAAVEAGLMERSKRGRKSGTSKSSTTPTTADEAAAAEAILAALAK